MSGTVQDHIVIPNGLVRNLRQFFEDRISEHQYERDRVYIDRAARNMNELILQRRTYAEQLRLAENATLYNLPTHLIDFLRDHDNMYRAAIRSRLITNRAVASLHMDVLVQVAYRIRNIQTVFYVNMIEQTYSAAERFRLMRNPLFRKELDECAVSLQEEIVYQLTHLEGLLPPRARDIELENVGPDHNIDDYGHELLSTTATTLSDDRDRSQHCCICLGAYSTTHTAFIITTCKHIVGKPCLSQWLNSTSLNANLCPHCRAPLCKRRTRRPAGTTLAVLTEQREISNRLSHAIILIGDVEKLHDELFGTDAAIEFLKKAMFELNYRLFENDIGFCLGYERTTLFRWGVRRVSWH